MDLILVDNGSSDDSLELVRSARTPFPISIVANRHNESFSDACNQGAEQASGELLLFLNNDVEPFESGWLRELVACLRGSGAGAVAATLLCRDDEHERSFLHGYGVQHRGLELAEREGRLHPALRGWEDDPLDQGLGLDADCKAVAAACMLISASAFEQVGGFHDGYLYGCEDVDLCLKLRATGMRVVCSGRAIAIHHPASSRRTVPFEQALKRKTANRELLWERWGPRLDPQSRPSGETGDPLDRPAPRLPETQIFHAMPAGSPLALVVFSAKGGGHNVFHFFKVLKPLAGYTKLLVRDPDPHWYNDGLPGVGETIEEIAQRIEQEVSELGATRIVTVGPSMGGYAAILFGCMLGAERAIALAPQTLLDPGLRLSPPVDLPLQAPDLVPFIQRAPRTPIEIVAGWDDHLDVFHAQRVADLPSVRILALRQGAHMFMGDLHSEGRLMPLIDTLIDGGTPDGCDVDPELDRDVEQRIADTAYATHRGDWKTVAERIAPVAERHPDWAGPNCDLGQALAQLGDTQGAAVACERAVRANPNWTRPRETLANVLSSSR